MYIVRTCITYYIQTSDIIWTSWFSKPIWTCTLDHMTQTLLIPVRIHRLGLHFHALLENTEISGNDLVSLPFNKVWSEAVWVVGWIHMNSHKLLPLSSRGCYQKVHRCKPITPKNWPSLSPKTATCSNHAIPGISVKVAAAMSKML